MSPAQRSDSWGCVVKAVTGCFRNTDGSCRRYEARAKSTFPRRGSSEGMPVMLRLTNFPADQLYEPHDHIHTSDFEIQVGTGFFTSSFHCDDLFVPKRE